MYNSISKKPNIDKYVFINNLNKITKEKFSNKKHNFDFNNSKKNCTIRSEKNDSCSEIDFYADDKEKKNLFKINFNFNNEIKKNNNKNYLLNTEKKKYNESNNSYSKISTINLKKLEILKKEDLNNKEYSISSEKYNQNNFYYSKNMKLMYNQKDKKKDNSYIHKSKRSDYSLDEKNKNTLNCNLNDNSNSSSISDHLPSFGDNSSINNLFNLLKFNKTSYNGNICRSIESSKSDFTNSQNNFKNDKSNKKINNIPKYIYNGKAIKFECPEELHFIFIERNKMNKILALKFENLEKSDGSICEDYFNI